ncbi:hypothetical protein HRbin29_01513 [bacterium HR29]|jgi:uncharacterized protein (DUF302 family)|nr:hypothetical protein HRbin29_01513 [bacterium HR29]
MSDPAYGLTLRLPGVSYDEARRRIVDALAAEGFGILTEIDVAATLKKKLGIDFRSYTILGACNPPLAHRALEAEPLIGLLLPCNVVVAEEEGGSVVAVLSPKAIFQLVSNPQVANLAEEVEAKLRRALESLAPAGSLGAP